MTATTTPHRTHRTTLSSTLIRIVCVLLTSVSLGLALLGLGLTCTLLGHFDEGSAPCPNRLAVGAFGAAGALLAAGLLMCAVVCRGRRRRGKEVGLEDLPCEVEKGVGGMMKTTELSSGADGVTPKTDVSGGGGEDSFDLTQVSFYLFVCLLCGHWRTGYKVNPECS